MIQIRFISKYYYLHNIKFILNSALKFRFAAVTCERVRVDKRAGEGASERRALASTRAVAFDRSLAFD